MKDSPRFRQVCRAYMLACRSVGMVYAWERGVSFDSLAGGLCNEVPIQGTIFGFVGNNLLRESV